MSLSLILFMAMSQAGMDRLRSYSGGLLNEAKAARDTETEHTKIASFFLKFKYIVIGIYSSPIVMQLQQAPSASPAVPRNSSASPE